MIVAREPGVGTRRPGDRLTEDRPEQAAGVWNLPDAGGMGQQMTDGRRPLMRVGGDEPEAAQVVVGRRVELDPSLLAPTAASPRSR